MTNAAKPLRWHVRNVKTGGLVPVAYGSHQGEPLTWHWAFDAAAWVAQQARPDDFEVVQADA